MEPIASTGSPRREHIPALDGVRGLAIALVLVFHLAPVRLTEPYFPVAQVFWVGVDLFFVLSGFLITSILCQQRGRPQYYQNFYARRALRILPLYLATLAAVLWIGPWLISAANPEFNLLVRRQGWLWTFTSNWYVVRSGQWIPWLNHFWSLAIEEQFYLLWPVVIALCPRRRLGIVCAALMGGALVLRCGMLATGCDARSIYVMTFARLDGFTAGGIAALCVAAYAHRPWLAPTARAAGGAIFAILTMIAITCPKQVWTWDHPLMQSCGYTLFAALFGIGLVAIVAAGPASLGQRLMSCAPLRWLGKYSFGIYVFHFPLLHMLPKLIPLDPAWPHADLAEAGIIAVVSILLAMVSWHVYERPWLALKRYFEHDSARASSAGHMPLVESRRSRIRQNSDRAARS